MASETTLKSRGRSRSRSGSRSPLSRIRSKSSIKVETAAGEKSPKSRGFFGFGSGKAASLRADSATTEVRKEAPLSAAAAAGSLGGGGGTSPSSPTSPPASPRPTPLGRTASFIKSAGRKSPKAVPVVDTGTAYRKDRLPKTLSALLVTALAAVAIALFYGHGDGPRLAKRDAPLYDGDVLNGGEYINTCTGALSFGCAPKYFELSTDGELGLYEGAAPPAAGGGGGFLGLNGLLAGSGGGSGSEAAGAPPPNRIWSSGTRVRNGKAKDAIHMAEYTAGTISLLRDGKVVWKSPVSRLPKDLQPWPLHS